MTTPAPVTDLVFDGTIWRMEIDDISDVLCLEIRALHDKKVSFASVSLKSGDLCFKDLVTPENWLTGIEAVYNGVLLLHGYQSESGPVHKGITAIDAITGEVLWSNYTFAFDHLSVNGPVMYDTNLQPVKLMLADVKTGATTRLVIPSIHYELNNIVLPDLLPAGLLEPATLPAEPVGGIIHYLEHNNLRIVSLHALRENQLVQPLYVFSGIAVVYQDLLNDGIQKIQPESFIVIKNRLIYIKNKNELKVLSL